MADGPAARCCGPWCRGRSPRTGGRPGGTEGLWCLTGWGRPWRQHSQWCAGTQRPAWLRKCPCWHTQPGAGPALQLPQVSVALGSRHVRSHGPSSPGGTCCHISPEGHSAREDPHTPHHSGQPWVQPQFSPFPCQAPLASLLPPQCCPLGSNSLCMSRPPNTAFCSCPASQILVGPNSSLAFSRKPPLTSPVHLDLSCGTDFPSCGCSLLVSRPETVSCLCSGG